MYSYAPNQQMYDVVVGRSESDKKKFGTKGAVFMGKHYVHMGSTTSLSNKIYLDVTRSHVVFLCGKRGSGKSYTMGVIAEGVADLPVDVKDNIAIIMLDTMGVYWPMKYANKKEGDLLKEWDLESKGLDIKIYTPKGYFQEQLDKGIPTDEPFSIKPAELDASDWCLTFEIEISSPEGVLIETTINDLLDTNKPFDLEDIKKAIKNQKGVEDHVKQAVINRYTAANKWGLFDKDGTPLHELAKGGQVTVLDVSCYATAPGTQGLRALVIGLVAEKLFVERMIARKEEEIQQIKEKEHVMREKVQKKQKDPLVWLVIDEAHEFLPKEGQTAASHPLIIILREGRQPGISLILATQQPGKIHTDVMTQSDIVISHRLTAKMDVEALGMVMQSYMREGLDKQINNLPRLKGSAVVFDDNNERMYAMRVRPRFTWHGGEAPTAMKEDKKVFDF
jgi:ABC-type dipeptide/oligopeptide/nickel transport system ATPase component